MAFFLSHMYYIYILYSQQAGKYYMGQSINPWKRLLQHNDPQNNTFTSKHCDWVIKAIFSVTGSRAEAEKMEKFIKKQKSTTLIERLIDPDFMPDGALSDLIRIPL